MENQVQNIIKCRACGSADSCFFSEKNGYKILRCLNCQTLYVANLPEDLSAIYGDKYFWGAADGFGYVNYDADKEPMRQVFEDCLQKLGALSGVGAILDVGAATGYFLKLAQDKGFNITGVEIGDEAAKVGRKRGLNILTGTIADVNSKNKFDAITMFDVIEHVKEPRADLVLAANLLNSAGALLIITPDSGSLYARALGKRWHLIVPPEHITLFNKKSLKRLLEDTGFEVLEISSPGKSFTVEYVLHTLLRWQKLSIWNSLLNFVKKYPRVSQFRLPINLHDNMMILARKIS